MRSFGKVSVVIPIRHGENTSRIIKSIKNSSYQDHEILVIDIGKERSAQRNFGAKKAKGKYLFFLDSDHTIHKALMYECVMLCNIYDGLYIPEIIVGHPVKTFLRSFYNGTRVDAIRFLKKKSFIEFDEEITGFEDWDFDRRFRGKKGITKFPLYHHTHGSVKKKLYYTKWLNKYKEKYPNCPELDLKYRLLTVWIENNKWKKLLLLRRSTDQI